MVPVNPLGLLELIPIRWFEPSCSKTKHHGQLRTGIRILFVFKQGFIYRLQFVYSSLVYYAFKHISVQCSNNKKYYSNAPFTVAWTELNFEQLQFIRLQITKRN